MVKPRRVTTVVLTLVLTASLLVSVGCTKYASQDDLQQLEAARKAAISAEKELEKTKDERKMVEQELSEKEAELKSVQNELAYVQAHVDTTAWEEAGEEIEEGTDE